MKTSQLTFFFRLTFFSLLFGSCQSSKPLHFTSRNPETPASHSIIPASENELFAVATTQNPEPKTVSIPKEKVLYAAQNIQPAALSALAEPDQATNFPAQIQLSEKTKKTPTVQTQDEPEKVRGRTLSGIFLAAGIVLLLVALGLVIAGISGAGIVAWIGGGLFLTGFIFSLLALLGR